MYCDVLISQKPIPVTYSSTEFSVLQWTSDMHVIGLCLFLKKQFNDNYKYILVAPFIKQILC